MTTEERGNSSVASEIAAMSRDTLESLLASEWEAAAERMVVGCYDCGLAYGSEGWIECIVPDEAWLKISPSGNDGSILCITCIARRLKRLGVSKVPVTLCGTEAIRLADQDESFERGWGAAKQRLDELESQLAAERSSRERAEGALREIKGIAESHQRRCGEYGEDTGDDMPAILEEIASVLAPSPLPEETT